MSAGGIRRGLILATLVVVCLGLGWYVVRALQATPQPVRLQPASTTPVPSVRELPDDAGFAMPPAREFVEIIKRPIFSPTRRPAPQSEVTLEGVGSELDLKLVGVIIASGEEIALVAPPGSPTLVRLSEGDRFQGWTVESIEPHRVTFRRDDVAEQIGLSYDQPPSVKPQPARRRDDKREAEADQEQEQEEEEEQKQE